MNEWIALGLTFCGKKLKFRNYDNIQVESPKGNNKWGGGDHPAPGGPQTTALASRSILGQKIQES